MSKSKFLAVLDKCGVPVLDNNVILVEVDEACEMASVSLNGSCVMMGNFWDFHPDCHGIKLDFSSYNSLADALFVGLTKEGKKVEKIVDEEWEYDE